MLWVRIPLELFIITSSRSSPECSPPCQGGDQGFKSPRGRFLTIRRGAQSGKAAKLKPSWSVGSTPTRVTNFICVGWALASLSGCNPPAFGLWRFNSVPTHSQTTWPVRLAVQDAGPSSRRGGFESRTGQCRWAGAQPAFIRLVGPVRYRDLHLQKSEVTDTVCRCFGSTRPW